MSGRLAPAVWLMSLAAIAGVIAAPQQATFRASVDGVAVDVHVTRGGAPVAGLTKDDFTLTDNGVAQQIMSVMYEHVPIEAYLVLDTSGSLAGEGLEQLKRAARAFLHGLTAGDRATLVTFSHYIAQRRSLSSDFKSIASALGEIDAHGSTSLNDAIYTTLRLRSRNEFRPVAVVFSDGLDNMSWLSDTQVVEAAKRSDVAIHAVSLVEDGHRAPSGVGPAQNALLRDLGAATGGRLWAASGRQLTDVFVQVLQEIRTRYLLTYSPTGVSREGWHAVQVKLKRGRGEIRARPGYFATPPK